MAGEPRGSIPSTTTPFGPNREPDEDAARTQAGWLLQAGGHGRAARGSTGAGRKPDRDELRRLAGLAADEAAGAVSVIAGIVVDSGGAAIGRVGGRPSPRRGRPGVSGRRAGMRSLRC